MYDINEGSVRGLQAGDGVSGVEVRLGGVQSSDARQGQAVSAPQDAAHLPAKVCS